MPSEPSASVVDERIEPAPEAGELDAHDEWNRVARGETALQRLDRAYAEIL